MEYNKVLDSGIWSGASGRVFFLGEHRAGPGRMRWSTDEMRDTYTTMQDRSRFGWFAATAGAFLILLLQSPGILAGETV